MDVSEIREFMLTAFDGVLEDDDCGNYFFFYDPVNRIPFVTIVTCNRYDKHSDLDRPGIYRLNIGIRNETFRSMFSMEVVPREAGYDFAAVDELMPHPVYGRQYWVCVLSPSKSTFEKVKPLLEEAYEAAVKKYQAARSALNR